jgi:hypothetical protein
MKTKTRKHSTRIALVLLSFLFFSFPSKTNAQEGAYWMGLATENPALIGTPSDWIWGTTSFADIPNYDDGYSNVALYSDYRISPKAGSVGANFLRVSQGINKAYLAEMAYAYTLSMKKNRTWNFGASAGVEGRRFDYSDYNQSDAKANYLKTSLGALYHSRKLDLGFSYGFYNEIESDHTENLVDNYVSFMTAYRFIIKEKFVIEPNLRMLFHGEADNDGYLGLHFELLGKAWINYNWQGVDEMQTYSIGADIAKRFRLACNYSFVDYYQYGRANFYQFSLAYKLN